MTEKSAIFVENFGLPHKIYNYVSTCIGEITKRAFEVKKKFKKMLILLSVRGNFLIALNSFHF